MHLAGQLTVFWCNQQLWRGHDVAWGSTLLGHSLSGGYLSPKLSAGNDNISKYFPLFVY